ncbi:hypothetical protein [Candidatus Protochlamydia phocaeensis]|uniref:hypothetical protein n=1 Tax=Candidatus Protochlamydia phocaeensis TaxID=1414722 RepID=UPI000839390B|nr:hypothetical protein [Candidatus Protochlamydia phocaeensis]
MNVLPLVLGLLLILSVLTIEKLERFKGLAAVQKEYQLYLNEQDRQALNDRQKKLALSYDPSQRQLSFRFFFDKKLREEKEQDYQQIRLVVVEFLRVLYGEAAFFKDMEHKRPNFIDDLLNDFIAVTDRLVEESAKKRGKEDNSIRRIEDIMHVKLDDPELQEVFYRMLKGTTTKEKLKRMQPLSGRNKEKAYLPLLMFINNDRKNYRIPLRSASRELLKAIFIKDEIVESILAKRKELDSKDPSAQNQFENEFKGKQRTGISDALLDFTLTSTDTIPYD